jgi:prefoldin subunit 5
VLGQLVSKPIQKHDYNNMNTAYDGDIVELQHQIESIFDDIQVCKSQLETLRKKKKENKECRTVTEKTAQKKFWVYTASSFMVQMNKDQLLNTVAHDEKNIEKEIHQLQGQIDELSHQLKRIDPQDRFQVQRLL